MSRAIDRQIAELMGYRTTVSDTYDYWYYSEKYQGEIPVPSFSSDWNAMRLLVEWLRGMGLSIQFILTKSNGDEVTRAIIYYGKGFENGVRIDAETAPLALCNAVLSLPKEVLKNA